METKLVLFSYESTEHYLIRIDNINNLPEFEKHYRNVQVICEVEKDMNLDEVIERIPDRYHLIDRSDLNWYINRMNNGLI